MSADNGIYKAKFPDGWRVIHTQGIDNIYYYPEGSKKRKKILKKYFKNSQVFKIEEDANKEASRLEKEVLNDDFGILEHGICDLGELEGFEDNSQKINLEDTEFFECSCKDRDHLIIVRKEFWKPLNTSNKKEISVYLEFVAVKSDWNQVTDIRSFVLFNFLKRYFWRIKEALRILFTGEYRVESYWEPLWTSDNYYGIEEVKKLGKVLIKYGKEAEKFYKS